MIKRVLITALAVGLLVGMLFCLEGCAPVVAGLAGAGGALAGVAVLTYVESAPITKEILRFAGKEAAVWGLQRVQSSFGPGPARAFAGDAITACDDCLRYLYSGKLDVAAIINQVISKNFANIHPFIMQEIQVAAAILAKVVPSADVALNQAQIDDLIAFISGIEDGCKQYLAQPTIQIERKFTLQKKHGKDAEDVPPEFPDWFGAN